MSYISIIRERNKYIFTFANGKIASVDLDNHANPFVGVSGKTTKKISTSINGIMRGILENACNHWAGYTFQNKEYIDRIISLPDISVNVKESYIKMVYECRADDEWYNKEWRTIIEMMRKAEQEQDFHIFDLYDSIERTKLQKVLEKYNLQDCQDYIDLFHLDFLEVKAFRSALRNACKDKYKKAQKAIMEMFGTEDKCALEENFGVCFKRYNTKYHVRRLYETMMQAEEYRKRIGLNDFSYTNIERDCVNLRTIYETEKTRIDNEFFARNQTKYNLYFEDNRYKIYVPKTRKELQKIGDTFSNCANGWEWNNRLSKGAFALVVVMMKDSENYRVCCDIDLRTMEISQYYEKYNARVSAESLLTFKQKYQDYLKTLKAV